MLLGPLITGRMLPVVLMVGIAFWLTPTVEGVEPLTMEERLLLIVFTVTTLEFEIEAVKNKST